MYIESIYEREVRDMTGYEALGTQKVMDNYQGIKYLFEVTDWMLMVTGKTFNHKEQLKATGYRWDADDKYWYKNFNDSEALKTAYEGWNDSTEGLMATVKSIYRQVKAV